MSVPLQMLLFFGVGIVSETLITAYYLAVSRQWAFRASALNLPITLLGFWVFSRVLTPDPEWFNALAYAFGNGVGCYCIIVASKRLRQSRKSGQSE